MKTPRIALAVREVNLVIGGALLVWIGSLHPSLATSSDAALERAGNGKLAVEDTVAQTQRTEPKDPAGRGASDEKINGGHTPDFGCAQRKCHCRGSGAETECYPAPARAGRRCCCCASGGQQICYPGSCRGDL